MYSAGIYVRDKLQVKFHRLPRDNIYFNLGKFIICDSLSHNMKTFFLLYMMPTRILKTLMY